jgi:hypothetical protein
MRSLIREKPPSALLRTTPTKSRKLVEMKKRIAWCICATRDDESCFVVNRRAKAEETEATHNEGGGWYRSFSDSSRKEGRRNKGSSTLQVSHPFLPFIIAFNHDKSLITRYAIGI